MFLEKIINCIDILKSEKCTIAFAEGASNGRFFNAFSSFAFSESILLGHVIAIDDHMKEYYFGVNKKILHRFGSESAEVARIMAQKLKNYIDATIYISVTGASAADDLLRNENYTQSAPIFIHIQFADSEICEEVYCNCSKTSVVEQVLARICELITEKLSFDGQQPLKVEEIA